MVDMLDPHDLDDIRTRLRTSSVRAESQFLDLGLRLEPAISILETLSQKFAAVTAELQSEALQRATTELIGIASLVPKLAQAQQGTHASFDRLAALVGGIDQPLARMQSSVKGVRMLAVNAKIAAAHLGDAGADFATFASEIGRTLRLAESSLDRFKSELALVGREIDGTAERRRSLGERQAAATRTISERLGNSVNAIAERNRQAVAAAQRVGERTQGMARRIGSAVMALQIGDVTRQRLEHVVAALDLLSGIGKEEAVAPSDASGPALSRRDALAATCGALQIAQLEDAAINLAEEVAQIDAALKALSGDAREILKLGEDAFGGGTAHQSSFLDELREEVSRVQELLGGFCKVEAEAHQLATSVSSAAMTLVSEINAVRSLEADIRILGLNTSLRCGRLGAAGRPLSIIAQELRIYANQIAGESCIVITDLDAVVGAVAALSNAAGESRSSETAALGETMMQPLSHLGVAGESLANALAELGRDGERVVGMLSQTLAEIAAQDEITGAMRNAAARIGRNLPQAFDRVSDDAESRHLLERLAAAYTMERERRVHQTYIGVVVPAAEAPGMHSTTHAMAHAATDAEAALEDVLF